MFRVRFVEEKLNLENFESVWARVMEKPAEEPMHISEEIKPEDKICIIKRGDKSRAIRFIPEI